jgi:hypothetical protein
MPTETKYGPCSVASKAARRFSAEVWILDNRYSKKLELLRLILCLTRLDKDI